MFALMVFIISVYDVQTMHFCYSESFLNISNIDANYRKQWWLVVVTQFLFFRVADPCLMVKTKI